MKYKTDLSIEMDKKIYDKLFLYIEHCDQEIAGFGRVKRNGNVYEIYDVFIVDQEVTSTSASLTAESIGAAMSEIVAQGGQIDDVYFHWHSHVNMDVFWSGTDENAIATLELPFLISLVGNKRGQYKLRIDSRDPFYLCIDDMALKVIEKKDVLLEELVKAEIASKVKTEVYPLYHGVYHQNQDGLITFDRDTYRDLYETEYNNKYNDTYNRPSYLNTNVKKKRGYYGLY